MNTYSNENDYELTRMINPMNFSKCMIMLKEPDDNKYVSRFIHKYPHEIIEN